jgi:hypothetical protein
MKKLLIFCYVGGSGGKFIINCLAHSQNLAWWCYDTSIAELSTNNKKLTIEKILNTIPSITERRTWLDKEKGCSDLFGNNIDTVKQFPESPVQLNNLVPFHENNIWLPIVVHDMSQLTNVLSYFKDYKISKVLLNATTDFLDTSIRLKWPEEHHCLDLDIYKEFYKNIADQQFDYVFNNWDARKSECIEQVEDLANYLAITYNNSLAKNYIEKYKNFYE